MKKRLIPAETIAEIADHHFAGLVLFARTWGISDAEDVVQNALMKLIDFSYKQGTPDNPLAWMYRTVRNEAISLFRKRQRRRKHETTASEQTACWFDSPSDSPAELKEVERLLHELPQEQREVVVLRIWSGLSFDEIAVLTETPKTSVFRLYHDALAELKRRLSI